MIGLLDHLILFAIIGGAAAFTVFVPLYAWWARGLWWHALAGIALMVSSAATALLLDLTLLFRVWPPSLLVGEWVSLVVIALIAVGGCLKVAALGWEIARHRRFVPPSPADR